MRGCFLELKRGSRLFGKEPLSFIFLVRVNGLRFGSSDHIGTRIVHRSVIDVDISENFGVGDPTHTPENTQDLILVRA